MPKLPRISASEAVSLLSKFGFILVRQSGSHKIYKQKGIRVTIPFHSEKSLHPKIVKEILIAIEKVKNI